MRSGIKGKNMEKLIHVSDEHVNLEGLLKILKTYDLVIRLSHRKPSVP